MTPQAKTQIKVAVVFTSAVFICILMQLMYIRIKEDEKALQGYERRADRATHVIDSLEATNAQRMLEIEELNQQLERNKERYEANISAIDSLDRNGLKRAMHNLLTSLTGERHPGESND
jgi:predicted RNase H-like nuclease (RuvC/YqgF family)